MLQACRKSCGKCRPTAKPDQPKRQAGAGAGTGAGSRPSGGGGGSGAQPERPANAAELLGDGAYSLHVGKIASKAAALHTGRFDLRGAKKWCDARPTTCAGFTVATPKPMPVPLGVLPVTFRRAAASIADDIGHVSYVRVTGSELGSCEDGGAREGCKPSAPGASAAAPAAAPAEGDKSSWHARQVSAYYLRAAELLSYAGGSRAQDVVDQVRAALLSGADRDACYMLRASAYLQLDNIDNAKRDLSAILRSDPEHVRAKALHRQLKKFAKAIDEGDRLRTERKWAEAVERYAAAQGALNPPIESTALRLGMCTCQLRLRAAKDAVIWCDKAHTGDGDDLTTLYLLVDAKALNGEEHAGLQLLKTAQRRFPRDRMLHDKIQALEQRIKRQGKVNYYKVLGVSRSATGREIKKAYHMLAKKYHPDKVERDEDKPAAEAMFKKVARAYEVLGDDDIRRRYDAGEDVDDPNAMKQQQQHNPFGDFGGGFPGGGFGGFPGGGGGGFPGGGFPGGGGQRRTHHFRYA